MPKRITLSRAKGWKKPLGAVVCSRPGKWGNPFYADNNPKSPGDPFWVKTKAEAVQLFREHVQHDPVLRKLIVTELRGKDLCCWCKEGEPCHVDVYLEIANSL